MARLSLFSLLLDYNSNASTYDSSLKVSIIMPSTKKKSKGKDTAMALKQASSASKSLKPGSSEKPPVPLNVPRLTMLILLAVGASKLFQIKGASVPTSNGDPSATCVDFLGEEVCQEAVVLDLLKYKYQSALSVFLLVLATTLESISSDRTLQLLQGLSAISFMIPSGIAFWSSKQWIPSQIVWRQLMVLGGLSLMAIPSNDSIPFLAKSFFPREKTLQSLTLISFALLNLFGCSQILGPMISKGEVTGVLESISTQPTSSEAVIPILLFFGVDKLASAGMFLFCWYYLTNEQQRVSWLLHF